MIEMMATEIVKELVELGWGLIDLALVLGIGYGFYAGIIAIGSKVKEKLLG